MKDGFRSNLHASRLENLLKSASNADVVLNSPLQVLTSDILWKSFERYRIDHNLHGGAKYLGNKIGVEIKKWREPASSNNFQSGKNDFISLQQNLTILKANLVKVSKRIQSMNNQELLDVIKTNHLHGIKYALNHILNPTITPRRQVPTITPRPYKELPHSIPTDHLV